MHGSATDKQNFRGSLEPHQEVGLSWLLQTPRALLADDVGLGKTVQVLALIGRLHDDHALADDSTCRVLWLTDASLVEQTKAEAERFLPSLSVLACTDPEYGTAAKWRKAYAAKFPHGPDILILNYQLAYARRHQLDHVKPSLVVLDEVMTLKAGGRHQKFVEALTKPIPRLVAMTATPSENNPLETYAVLRALHLPGLWPQQTFERDFVVWQEGYKHPTTGQWIPKKALALQAHKLSEVRAYLARYMLRRTVADAQLTLPQRVGQRFRFVPLTARQQWQYGKASAIGGLYGHHRRESIGRSAGSESSLVDAVIAELANRNDPKIVVCCETLDVLAITEQRLAQAGIGFRSIEGKHKPAERVTALDDFENDRSVRVLLGSRVLERGLNLQTARVLISLDSSWNPAREKQREGRICRIGSPHETYEHLTLLPDTPQVRSKVASLQRKGREAVSLLAP